MKHRDHLSQLDGGLFLTDWGIETTRCGTDHRHVREACEAWPTQSSD